MSEMVDVARSSHASIQHERSFGVSRLPRRQQVQNQVEYDISIKSRSSVRLHIQGLQRIDGVTNLRISSLQASHYPAAAFTPV
jgi:hypothetical protein